MLTCLEHVWSWLWGGWWYHDKLYTKYDSSEDVSEVNLMLTGPPTLASISPMVVFTRSGDKRDFFLHIFIVLYSQYLFNEKK